MSFDGKVAWFTTLVVLMQQNAGQKKLLDEGFIMGRLKVAELVEARRLIQEQEEQIRREAERQSHTQPPRSLYSVLASVQRNRVRFRSVPKPIAPGGPRSYSTASRLTPDGQGRRCRVAPRRL